MSQKWADFVITGKRTNDMNTHIIAVERRVDTGAFIGSPEIVSKEVVVNDILNMNITYCTAIRFNDQWRKGSMITVVHEKTPYGHSFYLRSDANNFTWDNLGELPNV